VSASSHTLAAGGASTTVLITRNLAPVGQEGNCVIFAHETPPNVPNRLRPTAHDAPEQIYSALIKTFVTIN
jgi:hypothetical protein